MLGVHAFSAIIDPKKKPNEPNLDILLPDNTRGIVQYGHIFDDIHIPVLNTGLGVGVTSSNIAKIPQEICHKVITLCRAHFTSNVHSIPDISLPVLPEGKKFVSKLNTKEAQYSVDAHVRTLLQTHPMFIRDLFDPQNRCSPLNENEKIQCILKFFPTNHATIEDSM